MITAKQQAIALIAGIPDDKAATVLKILENICELLNVDSKRQERLTERVEERLALMEEVEGIIGEGGDARVGKH